MISLKNTSCRFAWARYLHCLELTQPSDMFNVQLNEAYCRKKRKNCPIKSALYHYVREGWTIEILP
jgi:hypothetical protein